MRLEGCGLLVSSAHEDEDGVKIVYKGNVEVLELLLSNVSGDGMNRLR